MENISLTQTDETNFREQIVRLAARLGVDPVKDGDGVYRMIIASGDQRYDAMELLHAFLDRADAILDKLNSAS